MPGVSSRFKISCSSDLQNCVCWIPSERCALHPGCPSQQRFIGQPLIIEKNARRLVTLQNKLQLRSAKLCLLDPVRAVRSSPRLSIPTEVHWTTPHNREKCQASRHASK